MTLPIIKKRKVWFALSGLLVALSIAALVAFPLKFGIDFTGGTLLEVEAVGERPDAGAVREALAEKYGDATVQTVGDKGLLMRLPALDEAAHQEVLGTLNTEFGGVTELRFESVGPTVGGELRRRAVLSIALVLIGIAAYVAYAFRKVSQPVSSWKYGLTTLIVALTHDVLLPIGAFALLGRVTGAEVNSGHVAAILTVLAFSIHDTIVVFDRIRENLSRSGGAFNEIVEKSVNDTFARSINTSLTTIFPVIAIYFLGGESLRYFAFILIVGLVAGTYSSICLAAPILVEFEKWSKRR